jgi:hypothetical protein
MMSETETSTTSTSSQSSTESSSETEIVSSIASFTELSSPSTTITTGG